MLIASQLIQRWLIQRHHHRDVNATGTSTPRDVVATTRLTFAVLILNADVCLGAWDASGVCGS